MNIHHDASNLRRWAMQCFAQANDPRASGEERERLLKMRQSLLTLADNEDWLAGRKTVSSDTAHQQLSRAG